MFRGTQVFVILAVLAFALGAAGFAKLQGSRLAATEFKLSRALEQLNATEAEIALLRASQVKRDKAAALFSLRLKKASHENAQKMLEIESDASASAWLDSLLPCGLRQQLAADTELGCAQRDFGTAKLSAGTMPQAEARAHD